MKRVEPDLDDRAWLMRQMRYLAAFVACVAVGVLSCQNDAETAAGGDATVKHLPPPGAAMPRWQPALHDTWQWQLQGVLNTGYDVSIYAVDLFDAPQPTIDALKARGLRVVCHFSAGSSEEHRPDHGRFKRADMGRPLGHGPGERWLDIRSESVRAIVRDRIALAKARRCDGVVPDHVDAWVHDTGWDLDAAAQLEFNRFLAGEAHASGLAVGLKNDVAQVEALAGEFDFALNEQCFELEACVAYQAFTAVGKPVFNAEYATRYVQNLQGERAALCAAARRAHIRTMVLPRALDGGVRYSCD
ncbi:endo alpha-1,4 polygalactosaminidase [Caldimonas brevitalea]|uniref:Endo alpha-1,4 polygalactosaminidase n=1 Tax=Caldimonas brevitalea TaxID=413882 RepID=A0A0G3BL58_9BURK|nr:endo alpha-1,4 polygalactosaminidase [Caldimonas brevitalea]AKJ30137.1 endo alpha-1,4 polygalactosaminidase [Caldimonas brevitalea]